MRSLGWLFYIPLHKSSIPPRYLTPSLWCFQPPPADVPPASPGSHPSDDAFQFSSTPPLAPLPRCPEPLAVASMADELGVVPAAVYFRVPHVRTLFALVRDINVFTMRDKDNAPALLMKALQVGSTGLCCGILRAFSRSCVVRGEIRVLREQRKKAAARRQCRARLCAERAQGVVRRATRRSVMAWERGSNQKRPVVATNAKEATLTLGSALSYMHFHNQTPHPSLACCAALLLPPFTIAPLAQCFPARVPDSLAAAFRVRVLDDLVTHYRTQLASARTTILARPVHLAVRTAFTRTHIAMRWRPWLRGDAREKLN